MSMMGWACPKTAMQYVNRSRITSLQMSMYLANVQRRNCPDPFPSNNVRVSRKTKFRSEEKLSSLSIVPKHSKSDIEVVSLSREIETFESQVCTQDLLRENSEKIVENDFSVVQNDFCNVVCCSIDVIKSPSLICASSNALSTEVVSSVVTPVTSSTLDLPSLTSVDSRLGNILQNFQNHGSVQIHFHFGDGK
jgi:hypothetical protein